MDSERRMFLKDWTATECAKMGTGSAILDWLVLGIVDKRGYWREEKGVPRWCTFGAWWEDTASCPHVWESPAYESKSAFRALEWLASQKFRRLEITPRQQGWYVYWHSGEHDAESEGDTLPEAVCRAILALAKSREKGTPE